MRQSSAYLKVINVAYTFVGSRLLTVRLDIPMAYILSDILMTGNKNWPGPRKLTLWKFLTLLGGTIKGRRGESAWIKEYQSSCLILGTKELNIYNTHIYWCQNEIFLELEMLFYLNYGTFKIYIETVTKYTISVNYCYRSISHLLMQLQLEATCYFWHGHKVRILYPSGLSIAIKVIFGF